MSRKFEDTKTRGLAVQIRGDKDDPLLIRLYRYASLRGLQVATCARMIVKAGLDRIDRGEGL